MLRRALAAGGIGLWDLDPATGFIDLFHSVMSFTTLRPGRYNGPLIEFMKFVAPEDGEAVNELIDACARGEQVVEVEFRVHTAGKKTVWLHARGERNVASDARVRYVGTLNDVTEIHTREQSAQHYHAALFALARNPLVAGGENFSAATALTLTAAADALKVHRVSLWQLSESSDDSLACKCLLDTRSLPQLRAPPDATVPTHYPPDGLLKRDAYPSYFKTVAERRSLAVDDALTDDVLTELRVDYLPRTGVRALLDVPVLNRGKLWGIVCFENCDAPRQWTIEDQAFATSLVDLLSLALETSQRAQTERELVSTNVRHSAFAQAATDPIWWVEIEPPVDVTLTAEEQLRLIRQHGRISDTNTSFAKGYNKTVEALRNVPVFEVMPELFKGNSLRDWINRGYQLLDRELKQRGAGGDQARWLSLSLLGVIERGKLIRFWGARRNITEKKRYQNVLEHLAFRDPLTGLLNRQRLVADVSDTLEKLANEAAPTPCTLLLLDLNQFKDVNDLLGHSAGDEVLRQMRVRLDDALSNTGAIAARLGGDEFGVFARNVGTADGAMALGNAINAAMAEPFELLGAKFHISASIGAAIFPAHGVTFSALSRAADEAMYQAKNSGGGVQLFGSNTVAFDQQKIGLLAHLPGAIERGELRLEFQPIVKCANKSTARMEALVRWHHPEHGRLDAKDFIHKAEMSDAIRVLTRWVVDNALKAVSEWQTIAPGVGVSINISPRLLGDTGIVAHLKQRSAEYGVAPRLVDLEITETSMIHNPETASQVLAQCRALGFSIVMDDYGVGFCSLSYLRRLPLRGLKIDHSFVGNMTRSAEDAIVVQSTIALAHNLGLTVVAEGVEDAATLAQLNNYGCDFAQGYGVSLPLSPEAAMEWLKAQITAQSAATEYA
jgi:diguanylate cyclase (GGDEF)-like protein